MNVQLSIGNKIQQLRKEKKMTQTELAHSLSFFMGTDTIMGTATISQWELNNKRPSYENIIGLADYFGVSVDYLLGRTSNRTWKDGYASFRMDDNIISISYEELHKYHGKPVYIVFNLPDYKNEWGIYDNETNTFSCQTKRIKASEHFKYFAVPPENMPTSNAKRKPLTIEEIKNTSRFWVEYFGSTYEINKEYSGWYKNNETKTAIINEEGNVLPYFGHNKYYKVYKE